MLCPKHACSIVAQVQSLGSSEVFKIFKYLRDIIGSVGKLAYGLQERYCLRVAPIGSANQPSQSQRVAPDTSTTPRPLSLDARDAKNPGRRHTPYLADIEAINQKEGRNNDAARAARSPSRCANTAYGNRVRDSSAITAALRWEGGEGRNRSGNRTVTSSVAAPCNVERSKVEVPSQSTFDSELPRFAARTACERKWKAQSSYLSSQEATERLQWHIKRRASTLAKDAACNTLCQSWPHGLPVSCQVMMDMVKIR